MNDSSVTPSAAALVPRAGWLYGATFVAAAIVAAVIVAFFAIGIADGSVSSFNIGLWLGLLAATGGILVAAHALRTRGHAKAAIALLALLAVPGLMYGLLLILFVASGTRWN